MKTIITLALATTMFTATASPLLYSESTNQELQKTYANKDYPAMLEKRSDIEARRFCVRQNAQATQQATDNFNTCVIAISTQILIKKMKHVSDMELASKMPVDLYNTQAGRY